jgi:hypothetical protein
MHIDDDAKRDLVAGYTARAGDARAGHVAAVTAYVADTRAEALRTLRAELPRWLRPGLAGYVPVDGRARSSRDPEAYAELLCRIHPVGTAEHCVRCMATTVERTGIRHLILMVEGGGTPQRTRENIARLGAEVLPRLRARFRSADGRP